MVAGGCISHDATKPEFEPEIKTVRNGRRVEIVFPDYFVASDF